MMFRSLFKSLTQSEQLELNRFIENMNETIDKFLSSLIKMISMISIFVEILLHRLLRSLGMIQKYLDHKYIYSGVNVFYNFSLLNIWPP